MDVLKARERARKKSEEAKPGREEKKPRPKKKKRAKKAKPSAAGPEKRAEESLAPEEIEQTTTLPADVPDEAKAPEEMELTDDDLKGLYGTQEMPELPDVDFGASEEEALLGSGVDAIAAPEEEKPRQEESLKPAEEPPPGREAVEPEPEDISEVKEGEGEEKAGETPLEFLSFMLGNEEYALPLARISEIIKPRNITDVPRSVEFVLGVISLRGVVIPVFDLAAKLLLGNIRWERPARIIIVRRSNDELVGLAVDSVRDVVRVLPSDIEPPPPALAGVGAQYLDGVGRAEDTRRTRVKSDEDVDDTASGKKKKVVKRKLVILLNLDKVAML